MNDKPIIKIHRNKNNYFLTRSGLWVRDFTRSSQPQDINRLVKEHDYNLLYDNELANTTLNLASIESESIFAPNVVIVSDGFGFEKKQELLAKIPGDVVVIGTNHSRVKWKRPRKMDWFLANNPYEECMSMFPRESYFPRCIVSSRTNPDFVRNYKARLGTLYKYHPVEDGVFSSRMSRPSFMVDDYRNPICAAVALAFKWGVRRLLLMCCDDAFEGERAGAEKLPNGLWTYPQHGISHSLIEGMLFWLMVQKYNKVTIADHSSGPEYRGVPYISDERVTKFFG